VVAPNGRESFVTGENTLIEWGAPDMAVNFKLFYSVNNGANWKAITKDFVTGTSHPWTVPLLTANKKSCLVKVVGYNDKYVKVGADRSDRPFTIEVVKLTYPDGGDTLYYPGTATVTWTMGQPKREVASIKLYYTMNNGITWEPMETLEPITTSEPSTMLEPVTAPLWPPTEYVWNLPEVPGTKRKCNVKIVLKSATGVTLGSDVSDAVFTITNDF
jgi:hypothetical protein